MRQVVLLLITAVASAGCASAPLYYPEGSLSLNSATAFRTVYFEARSTKRSTALLEHQFQTALPRYLPGVALVHTLEEAELIVSYDESDMIVCVDCGDLSGTDGQDWGWNAMLSIPSHRDSECGEYWGRTTLGLVHGEAFKLLHSPIAQLLRFLRELHQGKTRSAA